MSGDNDETQAPEETSVEDKVPLTASGPVQ